MTPNRRTRSELLLALEPRILFADVTVVTHGFSLTGSFQTWVDDMAVAVANRAPGGLSATPIYTAHVTQSNNVTAVTSLSHRAGTPGFDSPFASSGEIVIAVDWAQLSSSLSFPASQVGFAVADFLAHTFAADAIHLIGHSRGASVMSTAAQVLGRSGIWVDQVTALDPHPVSADDPVAVYSNTVFADNYWRKDLFELSPDGQPVVGAANNPQTLGDVDEFEANLETGGGYGIFSGGDHSNVHLWYHGTIDTNLNTATPVDGVTLGANWYGHPVARTATGFAYSRLAGGARPVSGLWPAYGGNASRAPVGRIGPQWPNIDLLTLDEPDASIVIGEPVSLSYAYQDFDSAATVYAFADVDRNPYNGNETPLDGFADLPATGGSLAVRSISAYTTGVGTNSRFVFAMIVDDAGNARVAYAPEIFTFAAPGGSLAGTVFNDPNSNGVIDADESPIASWQVYLDANNNNALDDGEATATTDENGRYAFSNLPAGTYHVKQSLQSGYRKTSPASGIPGHSVTIAGDQQIDSLNFGDTTNLLLAGTVYNDANSNGVLDAGESGLAGVTVNIVSNDIIVATRTTDANGFWQVKGLSAGAGEARVVPPAGYLATGPAGGVYAGAMSSGQQNANLNFGLHTASPAPVLFGATAILHADDRDPLIAELV